MYKEENEMRIKEITSQHRRDFYAKYECENCGHVEVGDGYDDVFFHTKVIPEMVCKKCGQKSPKNYIPRETKYPDGMVV